MAFTYFFRDMQTLEMIRDHALPMLRSRMYINIWDAGCAMGPEPYSLAMIIRENMGKMLFRNVKIHATDIDGSNLFEKIIADGIYPREQVARIPAHIFDKYFSPAEEPDHFRISEEIRGCVNYKKHDLLGLCPVRKDFSLIMCKNVLLHFQSEDRTSVIRMFYDALADDGYFVTEQTQKMPPGFEGMFEQVVPNAQLFRKITPEQEAGE